MYFSTSILFILVPCIIPFVDHVTSLPTSISINVLAKSEYKMNGLVRGVTVYYRVIDPSTPEPSLNSSSTMSGADTVDTNNTSNNTLAANGSNIANMCPAIIPFAKESLYMNKTFYLNHAQFYKRLNQTFVVRDLIFFNYYEFYLRYFTSIGVGERTKMFEQLTKEDSKYYCFCFSRFFLQSIVLQNEEPM